MTWCVSPDVQTYKVCPCEYVVSTKHHADVRDQNILEEVQKKYMHASTSMNQRSPESSVDLTHLNAADDGGGESRVALRAQHDGVHQNKAARHTDNET